MTKRSIVKSYARILALGYRGTVTTKDVLEEIAFFAKITGYDSTTFLEEVISNRDFILKESGIFKKETR